MSYDILDDGENESDRKQLEKEERRKADIRSAMKDEKCTWSLEKERYRQESEDNEFRYRWKPAQNPPADFKPNVIIEHCKYNLRNMDQ